MFCTPEQKKALQRVMRMLRRAREHKVYSDDVIFTTIRIEGGERLSLRRLEALTSVTEHRKNP